MRLLAVVFAALAVAPVAGAGRVRVSQDGAELILTARLAPGAYGASCEFPSAEVGVGTQPTDARGKLTLKFVPGVTGAFTCWIHAGDEWSTDAAPLLNGKPARVKGVAQ